MENHCKCPKNECGGDQYKHQIMGKTIQQWFDEHDKFAFKKHLTNTEYVNYEREEARIQRDYAQLVSKYNEFVSDRISRADLVNQLMHKAKISVDFKEDFDRLMNRLDNETIQNMISVLNLKKDDDVK